MAAQTKYGYDIPKGLAGGKADIIFGEEIRSKTVEAEDGALQFGTAVAEGTKEGTVKSASGAASIAGVLLHSQNVEEDINGKLVIRKGTTVNVMKVGHVWGRLASTVKKAPAVNAKAYVVTGSDVATDIGTFTDTVAEGKTVEVGVFIGGADLTTGIAVVALN